MTYPDAYDPDYDFDDDDLDADVVYPELNSIDDPWWF